MLVAREPQPVGVDRAGFRVHIDQPVVPDERHAGAPYQTTPELHEPRAHRRPESRSGGPDTRTAVRHTLHTHPIPSQAQDRRGNRLSDILGDPGFDSGKRTAVRTVTGVQTGPTRRY